MTKKNLFWIACCLAWSMMLRAETVHVEAKLDSMLMWIGNQNTLHLLVDAPESKPVSFPVFEGDTIVHGLIVLSASPVDSQAMDNQRKQLRKDYIITSFDEGLYYVPSIPVSVDSILYDSNDFSLKIMTFDVDTVSKELFDIKPPMKAPFVLWDYALPVLLPLASIALILALIYLYIRFCKKRKQEEEEAFVDPDLLIPPHVAAIKALDVIREKKVWTHGLYKEFYTDITDVLRKYISRRFAIPAKEMTSSEILSVLKKEKDAQEVYLQLAQLMKLSDFVKFAKMKPLESENDMSIRNAYLFVEQTKIEETPEEVPELDTTTDHSSETEQKNTDKKEGV